MIDAVLAELSGRPDVEDSIRVRLGQGDRHTLHIQSRWRGRSVWAVFTDSRHPWLIVKVDHHAPYRERLHREHEALSHLQRRPVLEGLVPVPIALWSSGPRVTLVQSGLPGVPLNVLVRHRAWASPRRATAEHAAVLRWLLRLQQSEASAGVRCVTPLDVLRRLRTFVRPAAMGPLRSRLRRQAKSHDGVEVPLVPGHGDPALPNCLLDRATARVIDWEGGLGMRPALTDLVLFLNHYVRSTPGPGHRLLPPTRSFQRAFTDHGWMAQVTARSFRGHLASLGLPVEAAEWLFLSTALDLAEGVAGATHAEMASRNWTQYLRLYARQSAIPPLALPVGRSLRVRLRHAAEEA